MWSDLSIDLNKIDQPDNALYKLLNNFNDAKLDGANEASRAEEHFNTEFTLPKISKKGQNVHKGRLLEFKTLQSLKTFKREDPSTLSIINTGVMSPKTNRGD